MKQAATVLALLMSASVSPADDSAMWKQILTDVPKAVLPAPRPKVEWLMKFAPAFELAQKENRPLFITFRCLPCKQCAEFDKDVLEGGADLDPLLRQFVTVRVTNAEHIALNIFPLEGFQDLDLSWWGYFLSPQGHVYGIFGGKDHVSDATRISTAALSNTMQRVLAHHYNPNRGEWNIDGPAPDLTKPYKETFKLPGFNSWIKKYPQKEGCLHCHQVAEVLRQPAIDAGTFDKLRDTQVWPLPENVGIVLDRDDGLLVKEVETGSPAEKIGIKAGDQLAAAGGRRLFGQADFRGVLHRGPRGDGEIDVYWLSDGEVKNGKLAVKDGWRKTVLHWRMSLAEGNVGARPGFFPLKPTDEQRTKFNLPPGGLAIRPYMGKDQPSRARDAGLHNDDLVIAVNGQSIPHDGRAFLVWFRMKFNPGDEVTLSTLSAGVRKRDINYKLEK
jgi:hypothetical protein